MEENKKTMSRRNIFRSSPEKINEILADTELRIECRWMLCYMLSFPICHDFSIPQIMEEQSISNDRIYRILKELISFGYLKRERSSDESGYLSFRYLVSDTKGFFINTKPSTENPCTENPDTIYLLQNSSLITCIEENPKEDILHNENPCTENPYVSRENKEITVNLAVKPEEGLLKKKKEELHLDTVDVMLEMLNILKKKKPNIQELNVGQKEKMALSISEMLTKRDISRDRILSVFTWCVNDAFWFPHMLVKNPAKYIMEDFDRLEELSFKKKPAKGYKNKPVSQNSIPDKDIFNLYDNF